MDHWWEDKELYLLYKEKRKNLSREMENLFVKKLQKEKILRFPRLRKRKIG